MIWYLPLEPYPDRYTGQLRGWTETRLRSRGIDSETVLGSQLGSGGPVQTGAVLDAYGRSHWALTQSAAFVESMQSGAVKSGDVVFIHDMFHPGLSGIVYTAQLAGLDLKFYFHAHADSVDIYDFTDSMRYWKRRDEKMVDAIASGIFVSAPVFGDLFRPCEFKTPIQVVGLPFDCREVQSRIAAPVPFRDRPRRVVFSSRLDREKQPHFFFDLAEATSGVEFVVLSGRPEPRSNDVTVVPRLRALESKGRLKVLAGLSKDRYYAELALARVQFNCALQDFVSITALEASAFHTASLVPAFRSFVYEFADHEEQTYKPWSLKDAGDRLLDLLKGNGDGVGWLAEKHHKSLDRVVDVLTGVADYRYRGPFE